MRPRSLRGVSGVSKVVRVFEMLTEEELRNITRPQWCKTHPCVDPRNRSLRDVFAGP